MSDAESGPGVEALPFRGAAPGRSSVTRLWLRGPLLTLDLDTLVLRSGTHTSPSDGVSLMEAVSDFAGEPWSNSPSGTSPVIAAYARSLNDWLPDDERQRLKAYIPRLVGTAEPDLELRRAFACADAAVRVFAPLALKAAGLVEEAARLGVIAPVDRESAESARSAAESAESAARSAASRGVGRRRSRRSAAESARSAARSASSAARSAESARRSRRRSRRVGGVGGGGGASRRRAVESARAAAESAAGRRRRRRRGRRRSSSSIASSRPPHDTRRHQDQRVRGRRQTG